MINCSIDTTTAMRQLILKLQSIESPDFTYEIGEILRDYFNDFVPKKTGTLRKSAYVVANWKQSIVVWDDDLPYMHYQYAGTIYGPNIPRFRRGLHFGWTSPPGSIKYPTNRKIGEYVGTGFTTLNGRTKLEFEVLGYTTPGTTHHWIEAGKADRRYIQVRRDISATLKKRWEEESKAYYG